MFFIEKMFGLVGKRDLIINIDIYIYEGIILFYINEDIILYVYFENIICIIKY